MSAETLYRCDECDQPLPFGYVPEVDARGRFTQAVCRPCKLAQVFRAIARRAALETGK